MKVLGVIPARFASTRFPGKPLVDIQGKSMIRRVYEQALKATGLDKVVVATDDERIAEELKSFGGEYIMTGSEHQSGTDRCAEVARQLPGFDVLINIQGDEPFIDPAQIDLLVSCFADPEVQLATLIKEIHTEAELFNHNLPKVILNAKKEAVYFSRQTIPYLRNSEKENWLKAHLFYKHIGIYGYTASVLQEITQLPPSSLEIAESLEQLRWVENGYAIQTRVTAIETIAIDTPEDLKKILGS
ncbi:3-deoxy-manno-octulosonate cytidylyltransferase [Pedobacter gandavensis]|uniref:3-deoxy-manno-octulosonate cytidylyltransferase n=1 Tax=Pedobacter gandavensis TaxID=2679963 RepID=UPI00292F943F|nr:3-deoxy-manno-octulosonate cytidylyltransferase [Pedobacter gandavensis]